MRHEDYMSAQAALERLGIKSQTLYAYVSRGLVRAVSDPDDSRKSLYATHDVEALAKRRRRPRARADVAAGTIAWGEPVLESGISTVKDGMLTFRGESAVTLSDTFTLEDICCLHWRTPDRPKQATSEVEVSEAGTSRERLFIEVAKLATLGTTGGEPDIHDAWALLDHVATAVCGEASDLPIHKRLAAFWDLDSRGEDLIRRALVLISDHELNPSTFAVRVAASTGSSLAASVLAGLATLSGPLHGEASTGTLTAFRRYLHGERELPDHIPGFGHPLYSSGDTRAAALMQAIKPKVEIVEMLKAMRSATGQEPNIDAALAILALELDLPENAPFLIFAMGRISGWIAHALEQIKYGDLIRPRARFVAR